MGRKLKSLSLDGGLSMAEKACEDYVCRSCGEKMISANFVNGICIQIFVTHSENCDFFTGTGFQRTTEVTCETCRYYNEVQGCTYEGKSDSRIESVRTNS